MAGGSFCARCLAIFTAGPHDTHPRADNHHTDREEFYRAVSEGCYICGWVWRAHESSKERETYKFWPMRRTAYTWFTTESVERGERRLTITVHTKDKACWTPRTFSLFTSARAGIQLLLLHDTCCQQLINTRSLSRNLQYEAGTIN